MNLRFESVSNITHISPPLIEQSNQVQQGGSRPHIHHILSTIPGKEIKDSKYSAVDLIKKYVLSHWFIEIKVCFEGVTSVMLLNKKSLIRKLDIKENGHNKNCYSGTLKADHLGGLILNRINQMQSEDHARNTTLRTSESDSVNLQQTKDQIKEDLSLLSQDFEQQFSVLGLIVFKGQHSEAFCIQEKNAYMNTTRDKAIVSIKGDQVHVNGNCLTGVTDQSLIDQCVAMITRAKLGVLFKQSEPMIPLHNEAVLKIKDRYIAKTQKNNETIIFIQDENAWAGKVGKSFSINMTTHMIKKNGRTTLLTRQDFAFIKSYLQDLNTHQATSLISTTQEGRGGRNFQPDEQVEEQDRQGIWKSMNAEEWSQETKGLAVPGLRYIDGAELASRSLYFDELEKTNLRYDDPNVTIEWTKNNKFNINHLINQIALWSSNNQNPQVIKQLKPGQTITIGSDSNDQVEITVKTKTKIVMKGEDYARLINRGGDRYVTKFMDSY